MVAGNASAFLVTGLAAVPPLGVDPALEACLLEVTGQVAAPQPGLQARNVLPAANQHEQTAHEQAASDGIADDAVVLLGANVGQAGIAGNDPPGYLPCQTGASLPVAHQLVDMCRRSVDGSQRAPTALSCAG